MGYLVNFKGMEKAKPWACWSSRRQFSISHQWRTPCSWCYIHNSYTWSWYHPHNLFFYFFYFLLVVSICLNRFLKRNCRFTRYTAQVAKTLDEVDGVVDHGVISGIAWVLFALQHDSFFLSLCFVSDILKEKKKDEQSSQLLNLLNIILQMHSHYCFEGWSSSSSW